MAHAAKVAVAIRQAAERAPPPPGRGAGPAPPAAEEREEVLALRRWFCRRYPTPLERLAYVRRAVARWRRTVGSATVT